MKNKKKIWVIVACVAGIATALSVLFAVNAETIKKSFDGVLQEKISTVTEESKLNVTRMATESEDSVESAGAKQDSPKEGEVVSHQEFETEDAAAREAADAAADKIVSQAKADREKEEEKSRQAAEELKKEIEEYNKKVEAHNARLKNIFKNENPEYAVNNVKVHPAYMRYDDSGNLYVIYYITNGFSHPIYDITLQSFSLYTKDGRLIAQTDSPVSFGADRGMNANSYVTQDIVFKGDNLKIKDADLGSIKYESRVTNRY